MPLPARFRLCALAAGLACAGWLAPAAASTDATPHRCGTRWLAAQRAQGQLPPLPAARPAVPAATSQELPPIEVGTELLFPVSGSSSLLAATCRRVGPRSFVFVENRQWDTAGGSVLQSHVDALGELFDDSTPADAERGVYDLVTDTFGAAPDVDGYEPVFLLVLDMSQPNVVGFFDPAVATHAVPELRRDVLYLNQFHLRRRDYLARGTVAHEFQHLVHWGWDTDEEVWVDEGLSGYAEELSGYPEADAAAVPEFLRRPGTSLVDWDFSSTARSYGATYLFASFLAERYGAGLLGAVVAEPRNGVDGIDNALSRHGASDRFVDAWSAWVAGNYASDDPQYAYGALAGRRVTTFDFDALPLDGLRGNVTGAWATVNLLFRTPGHLQIDFDGDDGTGFLLWSYAMRAGVGQLQPVRLAADNRATVQAADVDSLLLIVGRSTAQGGAFELSARQATPTVVAAGAGQRSPSDAFGDLYPNPFNARVRIPYALGAAGPVVLDVHGVSGQRLRRLVQGRQRAGPHEAVWDGRDEAGQPAASGTYVLRLRTATSTRTERVALIR